MRGVRRLPKVALTMLLAWTSMEFCHVTKGPPKGPVVDVQAIDESAKKGRTTFLMIGNPGTGKSTILNGLIGKPEFKSGISFGKGMTYQLDVIEEGEDCFMDTPGLNDPERRKQAADAITEALQRGGLYKIFFVLMLDNGRVRPQDVTTMKIVLDAAPINEYGVIVNQLGPSQYEELSKGSEAAQTVLGTIWEGIGTDRATPHFHWMKRDNDLEEQTNASKALPDDLLHFISQTPGTELMTGEVTQVEVGDYEEKVQALERRISEMEETGPTSFWGVVAKVAQNMKISISIGGTF